MTGYQVRQKAMKYKTVFLVGVAIAPYCHSMDEKVNRHEIQSAVIQ